MENKKIKILAIDDNRDNLISIKAIISEEIPQSVVYVELSGQSGIVSARKYDPDVILLDIIMPGMDGYQVCKTLKADEKLSEIPIIFLTALNGDKQSRVLALEAGGEAFIAKPVDATELRAQIFAMLKIKEATAFKRDKRIQLEEQVQLRTEELKNANIAALNLLEDLKTENEIGKQRELELTRSKENLKLLNRAVEVCSVSVIITDAEGYIKYVNPYFTEITGYSSKEVQGKNPRILKSGYHPKSFYEELWNALLSGKDWTGEIQNRKKNGEVYWDKAFISPILNSNGMITNFVAIKDDITERKMILKELIAAKERAEESDRLKSAFLANMSHEIRTPMNGILGFSDLLRNPDLDSKEKESFIEILHLSGQRMLNTVNDIIEISKIESGLAILNHAITNVNRKLEEHVQFFAPEAKAKGLKLIIEKSLPESSSTIVIDQLKLDSILSNLIKNAIKYTDIGSIKIGCLTKGNHLEFYILDTGIGIPENRREAIFDRFVQADIGDKRAFQGSGLGLSITKAYVEMIGGTIWVNSEEGKGSCFYFTLPCFGPEEEIKPKVAGFQDQKIEKKSAGNTSEMKILIAEDDEISEMLLTIEAKKFGKEIFYAGTGVMAVDICLRNPDIDLIFMDIKMPEMGGLEATRQIRRFNKEVIIIAQTAYGLAGDRENALRAGCNDYIAKPIIHEELRSLLRKYFDLPVLS